MSFELFCGYWNPYRVEEANCVLTTSMWTPDWLEPEGGWYWLLATSPLTNQKNVHELITYLATLNLTLCLKTLPWKSLRSSGLLSSLFGTCNKCWTSRHQNPVSVDWPYCARASRHKLGVVTVVGVSPLKFSHSLPTPSNLNLPMCGHGYMYSFLSGKRGIQESINILLFSHYEPAKRYRRHTNRDFKTSSEKLDWMICLYSFSQIVLHFTPALNKCTPPSHWDISQTQVSLTSAAPVWGSSANGWSTSECTHTAGRQSWKRDRDGTNPTQLPFSSSWHSPPLLGRREWGPRRGATSVIPQWILRQRNTVPSTDVESQTSWSVKSSGP